MRLTTYNNATMVIEGSCGEKLLIDPWMIGDLYLGTWSPNVLPTQKGLDDISDCRNIFISHIHMDHWDIETIKVLHPLTKFFLPNLPFVERVIKPKLEELGFRSFVFIETGEKVTISESIDVSLIKPLNRLGAEISQYEKEDGLYPIAMDTGIAVFDKTNNIAHVLLCDNTPYDPCSSDYIGSIIGEDFSVGSVFYPFNGAAQDYPVCYDNLTDKRYIVESRNNQRNQLINKFCTAIDARICIPYSSDFTLNGPRAKEFLEVHGKSLNREWSACSMRSLGSSSFCRALLPGSSLQIDTAGAASFVDEIDVVKTIPKDCLLFRDLKSEIAHHTVLHELILKSLKKCRERIQRYHFSTKDLHIPLIIHLTEQRIFYIVYLNGNNNLAMHIDVNPESVYAMFAQYVALSMSQYYLVEWLENRIHFDNLSISCLLTWNRKINNSAYPKNLYDALNFFYK